MALVGPCPRGPGKDTMGGTAARPAHLGGIQVCGVLHGAGVVPVVPVLNHGVKQVSKHLEVSSTVCSTAEPAPRSPARSSARSCCWHQGTWQQGRPAGERGHGVSCSAMAIPTASAAQVSRAPGPGGAGCRALETAAPREPCVPQGRARAGQGLGRGGGSDLRGCGTCCRDWGSSGCCRCLERPEQDRAEATLTS